MIARVLTVLVLAISLAGPLGAQDTTSAPVSQTITVIPFTSAEIGGDQWLGKAIADRIGRVLAEVPGFTVLERARAQRFFDEIELRESGFLTVNDAARFGRVAKVDEVVYGNFLLDGNRLEINLILVDLDTQEAVFRDRLTGTLSQLHDMTSRLARNLVDWHGAKLTPRQAEQVRFTPTESLSATRLFYQAFDHYDHGRTEDAFGRFFAALGQDPDFHEARLWMGRVLVELGYPELAEIAFRELVERTGHHVEGYDGRLFLADLLETTNWRQAVEVYRGLVALRPPIPHGLEAAYRLADLLERHGDKRGAYDALIEIDRFVEQEQRYQAAGGPLYVHVDRAGIRRSRFFNWKHAMGLYREAAVRLALLYPTVRALAPDDADHPPAPRGTFHVSANEPIVTEPRFARTLPLFHETDYLGNWKERLYAVVAADGYVFTGARLRVTGRMLRPAVDHSYGMRLFPLPLPPNYHNAWLGAIYGQTRGFETLEKEIPFYGLHRRFLLLQLVENFAEIANWELELTLAPSPAAAEAVVESKSADDFWEGQAIASVSDPMAAYYGPTQPQFLYLRHPRRGLALVDGLADGLTLVGVRGQIGSLPTDLWISRSLNGQDWNSPTPLPINSASEDYAPQILRAEDGSLVLFWLSDRRGLGWEVWNSRLPLAENATWAAPKRIPTEPLFSGNQDEWTTERMAVPVFSVTQDRRGRWLLAYYAPRARRVVLIASTDGETWQQMGARIPSMPLAGLALAEDGGGVLRLAMMGRNGGIQLWSRRDPERWTAGRIIREALFRPRRGLNYSAYLFPESTGELLLLVSDGVYGLQYARFDPDHEQPARDLVPSATLEPFAATRTADGSYLVALKDSSGVTLRRYQGFRPPGAARSPPSSPLYTVVDYDDEGNRWDRTIARARLILPDVTAVGVVPDNRVWWGIETGVLSTKDGDVIFSDVSLGFPFHSVTEIQSCGDVIYFASRHATSPRIGIGSIKRVVGISTLRTREIPLGTRGRITALACLGDRHLYAGTSSGEVFQLRDGAIVSRRQVGDSQSVSAIAAHPGTHRIYVGTDGGGLYEARDGLDALLPLQAPTSGQPILAIAVDQQWRLWTAVKDRGLYRRADGEWKELSTVTSALSQFTVAALKADPAKGIWLLTDAETVSPGVAYIDDSTVRFFNPPHRRLAKPVDIAIQRDGIVWIATYDDGLYRLQRAQP